MWPHVCEECEPTPGEWRRVVPGVPPEVFIIPKRIGVVVAFNDVFAVDPPGYLFGINIQTETNFAATQIAAQNGIHSLKLWPRVPTMGADMSAVYRSDLDVIVVRPMAYAFSDWYGTCVEGQPLMWEDADYGETAEKLYARFSDRPITVILTGWENDHQARGLGCTDGFWKWPGPAPYADYLRGILNERQRGVQAAREAHPDAELQVLHAIDVNSIDDEWNVVRDLIPLMENEPDLISLSYWKWGEHGITEMLDYIQAYSGLPRGRIFIGEIGGPEEKQYDRIVAGVTEAMEWGCRLAYAWHWRQAWPGNMGLWKKNEANEFTGEATEGMRAIQELIELYYEED